METKKILIADDHQIVLDGLQLILQGKEGLQVVAQANNGHEALHILGGAPIDLAIIDLNMPGMRGIDLVEKIKTNYPDVKLLVITMHHDLEIIRSIMHAEAEGYVLKNSGKKEVLAAIDDILEGKTHYEKEVLQLLTNDLRKELKTRENLKPLSDREREILKLILQEFTSKEIADKLFISKQTVDTHRLHIMQKTGAQTLVGLIKFAISNGLAG